MVFAMALFVATAVILSRIIREPGTFVNARAKESIYEYLFEVQAHRAREPEWTTDAFHLFLYSWLHSPWLLDCLRSLAPLTVAV